MQSMGSAETPPCSSWGNGRHVRRRGEKGGEEDGSSLREPTRMHAIVIKSVEGGLQVRTT